MKTNGSVFRLGCNSYGPTARVRQPLPRQRRPTADAALFLAVALVFGTAFPAIEVGLTALSPFSFAAAR